MKRLMLILILSTLITLMLLGCTPSEEETPVTTEFGRMLGYVPYSFLEEYDIWFDNWAKAKQLYGAEDIKSIEDAKNLSEDRRDVLLGFSREITGNRLRSLELEPVAGFDIMMVDRMVFTDIIPPRSFSLSEGDFDEELIGSKLTGMGYIKMEYGAHTYYRTGEDYHTNLEIELSRMVVNSMNCLAVFDNTIIAAPAGKYVTGMFDAQTGNVPSIIDNAACRALADSLGDVLTAVMMTPERILITDLNMGGIPKFEFNVPDDWGILHGFEMAALGYRDEGEKRFLVITLYYMDEAAARADGALIIKRMESYTLGTWLPQLENIPFTDRYRAGEPVVKQYPEGAVLTVECQLIPEERRGVSFDIGGMGGGLRDLLFLAPNATQYLASADDIISSPDGWDYRANVQEQGVVNPWPPVESTKVKIGGPDKPVQVTYRSMVETKAGQTRNIIFTLVLPEAAPLGHEVRTIVAGMNTPEGITVSQDPDRQWYDGDPVRRVAGQAQIHVSADVEAGEYSFKFVVSVGEEEYGEVPCTVRVLD